MAEQNRVAIYVRVSTALQETDGTSLDTQEAACRRYAEEHGYRVFEDLVFRETYSGGELTNRPKLTALRRVNRDRQIDAVIFYAIDRLTRDQAHLGVFVSETDEHDVELLCVTEKFEDSPVRRFIRNALAFKAELERADIRERVMRGQRARVDAGKPVPGSRPAYGYKWADDDKTQLSIEPLAATIANGT
jgi:site-specific DNA recombinase